MPSSDLLNFHMHPQAVFIDSTNAEESYFLRAVRDQVSSTQSALIELPEHSRTSLAWISKLDSAALSGKFKRASHNEVIELTGLEIL